MLIHGNSYRIPLKDNSVHCVVTSPPYFGLRNYLPPDDPLKPFELGLEETPQEYVAKMVAVFREVWRVLRPDGTLWINIGDSYINDTKWGGQSGSKNYTSDLGAYNGQRVRRQTGLKPKNLAMIPARLALALQDDGWICRSTIIWHKLNAMPEPVIDRPTNSHEYVFLLTKNERYFYDQEAVRQPASESSIGRKPNNFGGKKWANSQNGNGQWERTYDYGNLSVTGRNLRSVWELSTESYSGTHYATFPTKLVEPCVLAATSQYGCCPRCGAPWRRVVEKELVPTKKAAKTFVYDDRDKRGHEANDQGSNRARDGHKSGYISSVRTTGWQSGCACLDRAIEQEWLARGCTTLQERIAIESELKPQFEPVPAIVIDPFTGSGTVGEVCRETGRRFVGIDLNPVYLAYNALPRAERGTSAASLAELPLFTLLDD